MFLVIVTYASAQGPIFRGFERAFENTVGNAAERFVDRGSDAFGNFLNNGFGNQGGGFGQGGNQGFGNFGRAFDRKFFKCSL